MSRWLWTAELWTPARDRPANISQSAARPPSTEPALSDRFQERFQLLGPRRMPELSQRLRLDLSDPFAGDVERAPDLLERVLRSVPDAEPHLQDLLLARGERLQNPARLVLQVGDENRVDRREHLAVLDEVAQMRILLLPDRGLERDRLLGDLHDLPHLRHRHVHALGDLLGVRLAAELLNERAGGARQLVDRLDHVDRDPDRPRLIGDRSRDRLADPPCRVGRELVPAAVLELLDRLHEADVPLLDQVQKLQSPVRVLLRDRDDEPQVRHDQLVLGLIRLLFAVVDHPERLLDVLVRDPELLLELAERLAVLRDAALVEIDPGGVLLLLEGRRVLTDRGLRHRHLPVDVLQDPDRAIQHRRCEVRGADQLRHVGDAPVDRGLDARQGLRALLDRARLELHPLDVFVERADLLDARQHRLDPLRRAVVEVVRVFREVDELVDHARIAARVFEELQDLLEDDGIVRESLVDLRFALLDALGDADLSLAVEELDRPHLAQIHPHGVVGLLDGLAGFLGSLGVERRALPRRAVGIRDDLDTEVEESLVDRVELARTPHELVGENRLDLLVQQVTLVLPRTEEELYFRELFLDHQVHFLSPGL